MVNGRGLVSQTSLGDGVLRRLTLPVALSVCYWLMCFTSNQSPLLFNQTRYDHEHKCFVPKSFNNHHSMFLHMKKLLIISMAEIHVQANGRVGSLHRESLAGGDICFFIPPIINFSQLLIIPLSH